MNTTAPVLNAEAAKKEDGMQSAMVTSANVATGGKKVKRKTVNAQSANLRATENYPPNLWRTQAQGFSPSVTDHEYATAANFALGHIATGGKCAANAPSASPKTTVGRWWCWRRGIIVRSWLCGGMR